MRAVREEQLDFFGVSSGEVIIEQVDKDQAEKERFQQMCEQTRISVEQHRIRRAKQGAFFDRLRETFGMKRYESMYIAWHFYIENDEQFLNFDVDASFTPDQYRGFDTEHIKQIQQEISELHRNTSVSGDN